MKSLTKKETETLSNILQKYFGCPEDPFLADPRRPDDDRFDLAVYLTEEGVKAYEKLTDMIYELGNIVYGFDPNMMVDELDEIVTAYP